MSTLGPAAGIYTQRGGAIILKTLIAGFRIRIRVFWSDPDPVLKAWLDPDPVLKTGSDLDSFLKLGRIWIRSEQLVFRNLD